MKTAYIFALAGAFALAMLVPAANAGSLLGGLLTTGSDTKNQNQLISVDSKDGKTSIGLLGKEGVAVNLPVGGQGNKIVDVPNVVAVGTNKGDLTIDVLGGGNKAVGVDLLGTGVNVNVPKVNVTDILGGTDGKDGTNGTDGKNGVNGRNGGGGGTFVIPEGISERLRLILRMLAQREYLQLSNGRAVCLTRATSVADVSSWITKKSEWGMLQKALASYSQDIYTLRQLLTNCGNQVAALNMSAVNRVIGIDIDANGRPVLYML